MVVEGLMTLPSRFGLQETVKHLELEIRGRSLALFARIEHSDRALAAGFILSPAVLLIFGNTRIGMSLMQTDPRCGLDLPLKMLVWEDRSGKTWLSYNDPAWIAHRYGLSDDILGAVDAMEVVLLALAHKVSRSF